LLSSTLAGVLAQRLVRRLCPTCKEPYQADEATRKLVGAPAQGEPITLYSAKGCGRCSHSGYEGRVGVYELIVIDEKMKRLIHDDASEHQLAEHAFANFDTLTQSGFKHAVAGVTSIEEVMRVVRQEEEDDAGL